MQQSVANTVFILAQRPPHQFRDDIPKSLKKFLDYIETDVVQDEYTKELDDAVIEAQNNKRWRERIMREEWLIEDLAKAKAESWWIH